MATWPLEISRDTAADIARFCINFYRMLMGRLVLPDLARGDSPRRLERFESADG